jgi:hypothetical protein
MMDPVLLTLMLSQCVLVTVNGQDVIVQVSMETPLPFFFLNVVTLAHMVRLEKENISVLKTVVHFLH